MQRSSGLLYFLVICLLESISAHQTLYYPFSSNRIPFNRHVRPITCNSVIDQRVQWLLSANYPSEYDEHLNCLVTVQRYSADVCRVELTFPDFNLEYSLNCLNDYFLLNSGIRLCGALPPDSKYLLEFPPNQDQLELSFVTNANINKSGFVAIFNQLNNSCDNSILSTRQFHSKSMRGWDSGPALIPTLSAGVIPSGVIPTAGNFDQIDCNQKVFAFEGNLKTPNYPSFYPTDRLCRYLFHRPSDQTCKIRLKIKTFDLNNYPSKHDRINCDNGDYLEIVNSANRLCGYKLQEQFIIDYRDRSNYLPIYFYSDSIGVATGFDIDFEQLPNSCVGRDPLVATKCDAKFKEENRLTSPGYPNRHEPNQLCVYEIEPLNSSYCGFSLLFRHLNLEMSVDQLGRCNKDYLELPNNERICGTTKPLEKIFEFNSERKQYLVFSSDNENESDGFDIQIKQIPCQALINRPNRNHKAMSGFTGYGGYESSAAQCDQLITGRHQIIVSPNYSAGNYPANANCQYSVYKYREDVCQLRLQILQFDLEASNQCQNDYLLLLNTGERFCGKQLHSSVKIVDFQNADAIRLRFISDGNLYTGGGFKIVIDQLENSCRSPRTYGFFNGNSYNTPTTTNYLKVCGIFNQEQFNIESPNYPLTYAPNTHCLYRICKANHNVHALDIFFNDFSVGTLENNFCSNDYLEINGERYCGTMKNQHLFIPFPSNVNIISIRFRTNERDNHLGFKLIVKQIASFNHTFPGGSKNFDILGLNNTATAFAGYPSGYPVSPNNFKNLPVVPNDLYYSSQLTGQPTTANDLNCLPKFFNQKSFSITSPGYRNRNYPCSIQCNYYVRRSSPTVCAIQLTFDEFKVEHSTQCTKDNLQIKNLKLCGQIPFQTKKTLEFLENQIVVTFKADPAKADIGFHISVEQIEC